MRIKETSTREIDGVRESWGETDGENGEWRMENGLGADESERYSNGEKKNEV